MVRAEPTFADAILDRIMHNAYRLELNGPSMRKIKAAAAEAAGQRDLSDTSGASSASTKPTKGAKR